MKIQIEMKLLLSLLLIAASPLLTLSDVKYINYDYLNQTLLNLTIFIVTSFGLYCILPSDSHDNGENSYYCNGLWAFIIKCGVILTMWFTGNFNARYHIEELQDSYAVAANIFGFIFTFWLFFKSPKNERGNTFTEKLQKFYSGVEISPKFLGYDLKLFSISHIGMSLWGIINLVLCLYEYEITYKINITTIFLLIMQFTYILDFYDREVWYIHTLDITLDRAGFYLLWGSYSFMPYFYTMPMKAIIFSHTDRLGYKAGVTCWGQDYVTCMTDFAKNYWIEERPEISKVWSCAILFIYIIYFSMFREANTERVKFRDVMSYADPNKIEYDKRDPDIGSYYDDKDKIIYQFLKAKYTPKGSKNSKTSYLLISNHWVLARKINYTYDIFLSTCFGIIFKASFESMLYPTFILIVLIHRAWRDDMKCQEKYGKYWTKYKELVPQLFL